MKIYGLWKQWLEMEKKKRSLQLPPFSKHLKAANSGEKQHSSLPVGELMLSFPQETPHTCF